MRACLEWNTSGSPFELVSTRSKGKKKVVIPRCCVYTLQKKLYLTENSAATYNDFALGVPKTSQKSTGVGVRPLEGAFDDKLQVVT